MHREVHLAGEQALAERADENAGPADLRKVIATYITERRDPYEFHLTASALSDEPGDVT
jgi:hypothetical protein